MMEKRPWYYMVCSAIIFLSLCYIRKVLTFFHIQFADMLSYILKYVGVIQLVVLFITMYIINKRHPVSSVDLLRDKRFLILFIIMLVLGVGVYII